MRQLISNLYLLKNKLAILDEKLLPIGAKIEQLLEVKKLIAAFKEDVIKELRILMYSPTLSLRILNLLQPHIITHSLFYFFKIKSKTI